MSSVKVLHSLCANSYYTVFAGLAESQVSSFTIGLLVPASFVDLNATETLRSAATVVKGDVLCNMH